MANNHWPNVPIPEGASVYKDRVEYTFGQIYSEAQKRLIPNRKSIGTPCEDGKMMRPNQTYLKHFSDLFQTHTGMSPLQDHVSIGLYAAISVIVDKNGLKSCLEKVFGDKRTKSILDYAMYAISCHSNVSEHFSAKMELNQVFSGRIYQDSYWSAFFDEKITKKEIDRFKELWVLQCVENGINIGYTSWDGSNNDCDSKDVEDANQGKAKSGTSGNIYGYMYCVAQDGTPITYDVHDGATPDNVAIKKLIQSLKNIGISIPGAIIDRGFDDLKCLKELLTIVDDYVVKLKENTIGFKNAVKAKGDEVRKFNSSMRIPHERLFGTSTKSAFFNNSDSEEWVHIFYDFQNGGERAFTLFDEIDGTIEDIKKKAKDYIEYEKKWEEDKAKKKEVKEKKPFSVSIPAKLKNYLTLKGTTPQDIEVVKNDDAINQEIWGKGLYAIGTHSKMTAEQANSLYKLRDVIEKLFDIIKTLLGFKRIRTKSDKSMQSRMFIAFIAAIIYAGIAKASKEVAKEKHSTSPKYDTTVTIDQLLSVAMILLSNGTYGLQYKSIPRIMQIFKKLNADKDILETVIEKYNLELQKTKKKQEKKKKEKSKEDSSDKCDGKSKESAENAAPNPPKRPRGRPPKNKEEVEEKPKRPRGRPPKPRDPMEEQKPKRPRGRPPKPKIIELDKPKRPRGRPRKNIA